MTDEKNETWADIAAELRKISNEIPNPDDFCPWWADGGDCARCPLGWGGKNCSFHNLADRIESAGKRAEENHKQELDRAVLNKDFLDVMKFCAEEMKMNQETATNCNRLGDASKLRETLEWAVSTLDVSDDVLDETEDWENEVVCWCRELQTKARDALAAPPRNCDVGAAEEQAKRFELFCNQYRVEHKICVDCPFANDSAKECAMRWAQMPYEATKEGGSNADA